MTSRELRLAVWRRYSWVKAVDRADRWQWYSVAAIKGGRVEWADWLKKGLEATICNG